MEFHKRRLIAVRNSKLIYVPKPFLAGREAVGEVLLTWEGDTLLVKLPGERGVELQWVPGVAKVVVAAYAAGLDWVKITDVRSAMDAKELGLDIVEGEAESHDGALLVKFVDVAWDKKAVVETMLDTLKYIAQGLARGVLSRRALKALDKEVDKARLTVNRLCAKWPTATCAYYIQLARYFERTADHLVELAEESPDIAIFNALHEAVEKLKNVSQSGVEGILDYLSKTPSFRMVISQRTRTEREAIHAIRVIDYLENAAEVYLDIAISKRSKYTPPEVQNAPASATSKGKTSKTSLPGKKSI